MYDFCAVCFWEDHGQDDATADEVWGGPNGEWSLSQARENFRSVGAMSPDLVGEPRRPRPDEVP